MYIFLQKKNHRLKNISKLSTLNQILFKNSKFDSNVHVKLTSSTEHIFTSIKNNIHYTLCILYQK